MGGSGGSSVGSGYVVKDWGILEEEEKISWYVFSNFMHLTIDPWVLLFRMDTDINFYSFMQNRSPGHFRLVSRYSHAYLHIRFLNKNFDHAVSTCMQTLSFEKREKKQILSLCFARNAQGQCMHLTRPNYLDKVWHFNNFETTSVFWEKFAKRKIISII
jgi:hypothetical protein